MVIGRKIDVRNKDINEMINPKISPFMLVSLVLIFINPYIKKSRNPSIVIDISALKNNPFDNI
jgi:hypothetical protein